MNDEGATDGPRMRPWRMLSREHLVLVFALAFIGLWVLATNVGDSGGARLKSRSVVPVETTPTLVPAALPVAGVFDRVVDPRARIEKDGRVSIVGSAASSDRYSGYLARRFGAAPIPLAVIESELEQRGVEVDVSPDVVRGERQVRVTSSDFSWMGSFAHQLPSFEPFAVAVELFDDGVLISMSDGLAHSRLGDSIHRTFARHVSDEDREWIGLRPGTTLEEATTTLTQLGLVGASVDDRLWVGFRPPG